MTSLADSVPPVPSTHKIPQAAPLQGVGCCGKRVIGPQSLQSTESKSPFSTLLSAFSVVRTHTLPQYKMYTGQTDRQTDKFMCLSQSVGEWHMMPRVGCLNPSPFDLLCISSWKNWDLWLVHFCFNS